MAGLVADVRGPGAMPASLLRRVRFWQIPPTAAVWSGIRSPESRWKSQGLGSCVDLAGEPPNRWACPARPTMTRPRTES